METTVWAAMLVHPLLGWRRHDAFVTFVLRRYTVGRILCGLCVWNVSPLSPCSGSSGDLFLYLLLLYFNTASINESDYVDMAPSFSPGSRGTVLKCCQARLRASAPVTEWLLCLAPTPRGRGSVPGSGRTFLLFL
uniref:Putative secreted protein n=1 Tax=Ixodes ricinus TaxID=34613 RepID=A0A6B0US47_IXORI